MFRKALEILLSERLSETIVLMLDIHKSEKYMLDVKGCLHGLYFWENMQVRIFGEFGVHVDR